MKKLNKPILRDDYTTFLVEVKERFKKSRSHRTIAAKNPSDRLLDDWTDRGFFARKAAKAQINDWINFFSMRLYHGY